MAHIANRSRFRVTVENKPEATRDFSFNKLAEVEADMKELRAQHLTPKAVQPDESWLVRVRDQGHKPLEATFSSEAAATQFVDKVTLPFGPRRASTHPCNRSTRQREGG